MKLPKIFYFFYALCMQHQEWLHARPPLDPKAPACCWTAFPRVSTTRLHGYRRTPIYYALQEFTLLSNWQNISLEWYNIDSSSKNNRFYKRSHEQSGASFYIFYSFSMIKRQPVCQAHQFFHSVDQAVLEVHEHFQQACPFFFGAIHVANLNPLEPRLAIGQDLPPGVAYGSQGHQAQLVDLARLKMNRPIHWLTTSIFA